MFRYSKLITLFLAALLAASSFTSCETTPAPQPVPVQPVVAKSYKITLFDTNGAKAATYNVTADGIVYENALNQEIHFRTTGGSLIKHRGSYEKEPLQ